eukprot:g12660.t1
MASIAPAPAAAKKEEDILDLFGFMDIKDGQDGAGRGRADSNPFDELVSEAQNKRGVADPFADLTGGPDTSPSPEDYNLTSFGSEPGPGGPSPGQHTTLRATTIRPASPMPLRQQQHASPMKHQLEEEETHPSKGTSSPGRSPGASGRKLKRKSSTKQKINLTNATMQLANSPGAQQTQPSIHLPTIPHRVVTTPASSSPVQPSYRRVSKPRSVSESMPAGKSKQLDQYEPAIDEDKEEAATKPPTRGRAASSDDMDLGGKPAKKESELPVVVLCVGPDTSSTNRALSWIQNDSVGLCGQFYLLYLVTCDKGNKDPSEACALLDTYSQRVPQHVMVKTKMLRDDGRGVGHTIKAWVNKLMPKLVVVGTREVAGGTLWRRVAGSTSIFLVHHCHCPVLVVKDTQTKHTGKPLHVALAVDTNVHSQRAVQWFIKFANLPKDANMVILYAVGASEEKPAGREFLANFKPVAQGSTKTWQMKSALVFFKDLSPSEAIVKYVEDYHCDMLVIASRDLQTMNRKVIGSMSDTMVHNGKCDVLVFKDALTRELYHLAPDLGPDFEIPVPELPENVPRASLEREGHEAVLEYIKTRRQSSVY